MKPGSKALASPTLKAQDPKWTHGMNMRCRKVGETEFSDATQAFGVYQDDYRRVDGRWWFARRDYQSLARSGRGEVFAFPADRLRIS